MINIEPIQRKKIQNFQSWIFLSNSQEIFSRVLIGG